MCETPRPRSARLLQRAKSAGPAFRCKSAAPPKVQAVVVYVDENCPVHGVHGSCICSRTSIDEQGGSTESLHHKQPHHHGSYNDLSDQQQQQESDNDDGMVLTGKPFNNNPPLPNTQRDIVGNNLHFHSPPTRDGWSDAENANLAALLFYRDALKRNLTTPAMAGGGLPKMRHGRIGSTWRHIKQTNTYAGANLMFIDGTVRVEDSFKYPIPRFGYPPLKRQQHMYAASNNDLTTSSPYDSPVSKSMDAMSWSASDALTRRPSLSQYSNRYQRHAKDGFAYWPTDLTYQKPRARQSSTGTYKTWLGLSDAVLKL